MLAKEIARCHDMTDKPFGVNLTFLPAFTTPPYPEYIAAIREGGIKIVETAGRSPEQYMPALKAGGIKVIHKCTSVRHSLKAEAIGCDAVSVDGFECGGHPGEDDMPNMILLPRAAEELKIPFVASGGMADARSLVAVLAMGAAGMNMGTRFMATKEAPIHDNVKKALVAASELDTRLVMRALRNTERVLKNKAVDRLLEIEREKGAALKIADIHDQVAGAYPKVMIDGDLDAGAWSCGMVAGLIKDVPTVKELIDRIMADAERIIRDRLVGFLDGDAQAIRRKSPEASSLLPLWGKVREAPDERSLSARKLPDEPTPHRLECVPAFDPPGRSLHKGEGKITCDKLTRRVKFRLTRRANHLTILPVSPDERGGSRSSRTRGGMR